MQWRTKIGGAAPVAHRSREEADTYVDELREHYRAGTARVHLVRLYDPDGGVRLIDFAAEAKDAARALRDLERATAAKERSVREIMARWEAAVRRAVEQGHPLGDVAAAAGISVRDLRALLRRE